MFRLLNKYLKDEATLSTKIEENEYGESVFIDSIIKCKILEQFTKQYEKDGNSINCNALIYLRKETEVKIGDKINGFDIIKLVELKDHRNRLIFKEVLI